MVVELLNLSRSHSFSLNEQKYRSFWYATHSKKQLRIFTGTHRTHSRRSSHHPISAPRQHCSGPFCFFFLDVCSVGIIYLHRQVLFYYQRTLYRFAAHEEVEMHLRRTVFEPLGLCGAPLPAAAAARTALPSALQLYAAAPRTTSVRFTGWYAPAKGDQLQPSVYDPLSTRRVVVPPNTTTAVDERVASPPTAASTSTNAMGTAPPPSSCIVRGSFADVGLPFCLAIQSREAQEQQQQQPHLWWRKHARRDGAPSPASLGPQTHPPDGGDSPVKEDRYGTDASPPACAVVVVDVGCAEAVLRGSDVYAPGVVTMSRAFLPGQRVLLAVEIARVLQQEAAGASGPVFQWRSTLSRGREIPPALLRPAASVRTQEQGNRTEAEDGGGGRETAVQRLVVLGGGTAQMEAKEILRDVTRRGVAVRVEWNAFAQPSKTQLEELLRPLYQQCYDAAASQGAYNDGDPTTPPALPPTDAAPPPPIFLQNYSSMLPVALLINHLYPDGEGERRRVLDACAAPGGKSSLLLSLLQRQSARYRPQPAAAPHQQHGEGGEASPGVRLVCCERSRSRHAQLVRLLREHFPSPPTGGAEEAGRPGGGVDPLDGICCCLCNDANQLVKQQQASEREREKGAAPALALDAVLLDPPCSGLGLRPKLLPHTHTLADIQGAADYQRKLFDTAVRLLLFYPPDAHTETHRRPQWGDGHPKLLVYSTCTITLEENEANVLHFLQTFPQIRLARAKGVAEERLCAEFHPATYPGPHQFLLQDEIMAGPLLVVRLMPRPLPHGGAAPLWDGVGFFMAAMGGGVGHTHRDCKFDKCTFNFIYLFAFFFFSCRGCCCFVFFLMGGSEEIRVVCTGVCLLVGIEFHHWVSTFHHRVQKNMPPPGRYLSYIVLLCLLSLASSGFRFLFFAVLKPSAGLSVFHFISILLLFIYLFYFIFFTSFSFQIGERYHLLAAIIVNKQAEEFQFTSIEKGRVSGEALLLLLLLLLLAFLRLSPSISQAVSEICSVEEEEPTAERIGSSLGLHDDGCVFQPSSSASSRTHTRGDKPGALNNAPDPLTHGTGTPLPQQQQQQQHSVEVGERKYNENNSTGSGSGGFAASLSAALPAPAPPSPCMEGGECPADPLVATDLPPLFTCIAALGTTITGGSFPFAQPSQTSAPPTRQQQHLLNASLAAPPPSNVLNPAAEPTAEVTAHHHGAVFEEAVQQVEAFLLEAFAAQPTLASLLVSPAGGEAARRLSSAAAFPTPRKPPLSASPTPPPALSPAPATATAPAAIVTAKDFYFLPPLPGPLHTATATAPRPSIAPLPARVEIHYGDDGHEIARRHGVPFFLVIRPIEASPAAAAAAAAAAGEMGGAQAAFSLDASAPVASRDHSQPSPRGSGPATGSLRLGANGEALGRDVDASLTASPSSRGGSGGGGRRSSSQKSSVVTPSLSYALSSSFYLSVLWTAANKVFGPGGPLQLDLQRLFHDEVLQRSATCAGGGAGRLASVLYPPPPLRRGAGIRLSSIFTPPTTLVPCFTPHTIVYRTAGDAAGEEGQAAVAAAPRKQAARREAYEGVSTVHTHLSSRHRQLVLLAKGELPLAEEEEEEGEGKEWSTSATGAHQRRLLTLYRDFPLVTTGSLPAITSFFYRRPSGAAPPPLTPTQGIAVTPQQFAAVGHEMMRYLLELLRLELGPRAYLHPWPTNAASLSYAGASAAGLSPISIAPQHAEAAGRRVDVPHGGGPGGRGVACTPVNHPPCCSLSLRKAYQLVLPRPSSSAFAWSASDTTWDTWVAAHNKVLRSRVPATTYSVSLLSRPIDHLSFTFQLEQLSETAALHQGALDPFSPMLLHLPPAHAPSSPSSADHRDPSLRIARSVAEACTIKAQVVLKHRDECQHESVKYLQPALRRFLACMRHAITAPPPVVSPSLHASMAAGLSSTRVQRSSNPPAPALSHGIAGGGVFDEGDLFMRRAGEEDKDRPRYIHVRDTVAKMLRRPVGDPGQQAAMVAALADGPSGVPCSAAAPCRGPHASGAKPMTALMAYEQEERTSILERFGRGRPPRRLPARDHNPKMEAEEALALDHLLRTIATAAAKEEEVSGGPARAAAGDGNTTAGNSATDYPVTPRASALAGAACPTATPARASGRTASGPRDIRVGYLPGSFLCRFAYHSAELLSQCEDLEEDGVAALMEAWTVCLDEITRLLHQGARFQPGATAPSHPSMAELATARKALENLLLILWMPKQHPGQKDADSPIDLTQSLLVQKLQFLAYCVRRLHDAAGKALADERVPRGPVEDGGGVPRAQRSTSVQQEGSRVLAAEEEAEVLLDGAPVQEPSARSPQPQGTEGSRSASSDWEEDEEDEEGEGAEVEMSLGGSRRPCPVRPCGDAGGRLCLVTHGEALHPPSPLPPVPTTSDILFQQSTLPFSASELHVVDPSTLYTFGVYNDMCLFLHVNRGRVVRFPDFVQWVSPRDFRRPPVEPCDDDNAYLSDRMKIPVEEATLWKLREVDGAGADGHKELHSGSAADPPTADPLMPHFTAPPEEKDEVPQQHIDPSPASTATMSTAGKNNVWWALWCRATPRSPERIIADALRHYDQALELVQWMRVRVTPAILCLELAQASLANAVHRLLVDHRAIPIASSDSLPPQAQQTYLRPFLQRKAEVLYQRLSPLVARLSIAPNAGVGGGGMAMALPITLADCDDAQVALEEAIWEMCEMETAVSAAMELEESVARELGHPPSSTVSTSNAPTATSSPSLSSSTMEQVVEECLAAVHVLCTPAPSQPKSGGDRLVLTQGSLTLAAWQKGFAPLFDKASRVPQDATVRITCLAENPAGTAPCCQQLVAQEHAGESLRVSISLSKEVL
eukprot:gene9320-6557_t